MRHFARRAVVFCACALPVGGVALARPSLAEDWGLDFWNVPHLRGEIAAARARDAELDLHAETIGRRMAVKNELTEALIDGRRTLFAVAARFRDLAADEPEKLAAIRTSYPGGTDDEKWCRNVIDYVRGRLAHDHPARADAVSRLETELQAHLSEHGEIHLP